MKKMFKKHFRNISLLIEVLYNQIEKWQIGIPTYLFSTLASDKISGQPIFLCVRILTIHLLRNIQEFYFSRRF